MDKFTFSYQQTYLWKLDLGHSPLSTFESSHHTNNKGKKSPCCPHLLQRSVLSLEDILPTVEAPISKALLLPTHTHEPFSCWHLRKSKGKRL